MLRPAFERSRDDLIHELGSQLTLGWGAGPFGARRETRSAAPLR
jgi:hypothetical protein